MKVRCKALFGDKVWSACLAEAMSQLVRGGADKVLEVDAGGAPVQIEDPRAMGVEIVEATNVEWEALIDAGFELKRA